MKITISSDSDSDGDKRGESEYFLNLHMSGRLVRDLHLRYAWGMTVRIREDPDEISYFELVDIVKKSLVYNNLLSIHYYVTGRVDDGFGLDGLGHGQVYFGFEDTGGPFDNGQTVLEKTSVECRQTILEKGYIEGYDDSEKVVDSETDAKKDAKTSMKKGAVKVDDDAQKAIESEHVVDVIEVTIEAAIHTEAFSYGSKD
ncbi:hypothetical protein PTKIN_Ptkin15bG0079700 [Pterospermum kingtungense]